MLNPIHLKLLKIFYFGRNFHVKTNFTKTTKFIKFDALTVLTTVLVLLIGGTAFHTKR